MRKILLMLLAVFWLAAVGWSKTTNPTTTVSNDATTTTNLEFLQDWSPPSEMTMTLNNETINANHIEKTDRAMLESEKNYVPMAVAAVHVMKIVQSPNTGYFNNNDTTANSANTNRSDENQNDDIGGLSKFC